MLSAILYLGNVTYKKKATGRDEGLEVGPPEVLDILSQLLKVEYYFPALLFGTPVCCALPRHFAWIHCGSACCVSVFYDASIMFILWEAERMKVVELLGLEMECSL